MTEVLEYTRNSHLGIYGPDGQQIASFLTGLPEHSETIAPNSLTSLVLSRETQELMLSGHVIKRTDVEQNPKTRISIDVGRLIIDDHYKTVTLDEAVKNLTATDYRILLFFYTDGYDRITDEDTIKLKVLGSTICSDSVLRVHICRIRKQLGLEIFANARSLGYGPGLKRDDHDIFVANQNSQHFSSDSHPC
jgi:hypothetical protein